MVNVLVDTSVLIEEARRGSNLWNNLKILARSEKILLVSSVVVLAELWSGKSMDKEDELAAIEEMIRTIKFIEIDRILAKKSGEIIRNYGIAGFDAVMAATAMEYGAELATLNTKHFKNIKGLKLYNENL